MNQRDEKQSRSVRAVGLLFDRGEGIAIMRQGNLIYCLNEYQESSHDREERAWKVKEYSTEL